LKNEYGHGAWAITKRANQGMGTIEFAIQNQREFGSGGKQLNKRNPEGEKGSNKGHGFGQKGKMQNRLREAW